MRKKCGVKYRFKEVTFRGEYWHAVMDADEFERFVKNEDAFVLVLPNVGEVTFISTPICPIMVVKGEKNEEKKLC